MVSVGTELQSIQPSQVVPSQGRPILPPSTHKPYTNLPLAAKQGQDVPECKPVRSPFYHLLYPGQTPRVSLDLVECERPDAPTRKTSAVTPLCTLSFKVDLEREELQEFTNSNCARYHKLSFEVEMIPAGASVEFVVYVDGRKQGARNVNVRFE